MRSIATGPALCGAGGHERYLVDVIAVGGVQTMTRSRSPRCWRVSRWGLATRFRQCCWQARFGNQPVNQFYAAQRIADHWQISRQDMEAYALESHRRALEAIAGGRFAAQNRAL